MPILKLAGKQSKRVAQFDILGPKISVQGFRPDFQWQGGTFDHKIELNHTKKQVPDLG